MRRESVLAIDSVQHMQLSNPDTFGAKKVPISGIVMHTNSVFGTVKCVLFIKVSLLVRCPDFKGCNVRKQGVWDSQMCPVY